MVRINDTLYFASWSDVDGELVFAYDLSTKTAKTIFKLPVGAESLGMTTDGKHLYLSMMVTTASSGSTQYEEQILRVETTGTYDRKVLLKTQKLGWTIRRMLWLKDMLYLTNGTTLARLDLKSGILSTFLGSATEAGCQDGMGAQARFTKLAGIATDGARLWLGDAGCHTIRQVDLATMAVTTLAGSPDNKTFKAGMGSQAGINFPGRLLYDKASKTLYVSDSMENIVMRITEPSAAGGRDGGVDR